VCLDFSRGDIHLEIIIRLGSPWRQCGFRVSLWSLKHTKSVGVYHMMPNKTPEAKRDGVSSSAVAEGVIRPARLSSERYVPLMSVLRNLLLVALLVFLSGCDEKELAAFVQQPLTIFVFKDGRPISERHVSPPSSDHERLSSWLARHQSGWHSSFITYAPGVLVSGTNFAINVRHSSVIVNAGGRQLVRNANDADFEFLLHEPGS
jgi:hypothetical protein